MSRTRRKCPYNFCYYGHSSAKEFRDKKKWGKPPHWFKTMYRQIERAKVKDALRREDFDNIPRFRSSDQWNWT